MRYNVSAITKEIQLARKIQRVKDEYSEDRVIICVQKDTVLDEIQNLVEPRVGDAEFQVHGHTLHIPIDRIDVIIPIYYFSIPQTCSHSNIEYSLDDLRVRIQDTKELAKEYVKKLDLGLTCRLIVDGISIHKHPGRFGFSSTDLSKTLDPASVVYRSEKADDKIQVDCILAEGEIYTAEGKVVNVRPTDDDNVEGTYMWYPTINATYCGQYHPILGKLEDVYGKYNLTFYRLKPTRYARLTQILDFISEIIDKIDPIIDVNPEDYDRKTYSYLYDDDDDDEDTIFPKPKTIKRTSFNL